MKNSWLILLLMTLSIGLKAQNETVYFSRILSDQEIHNPAYSAYRQNIGFKLLYNSKFGALKGNSETYGLNFSIPIVKSEIGTSFNILNEKIGLRQVLNINGCLNSCIKLSSLAYLSGGISLGIRSQNYRKSDIIIDEDEDLTTLKLNSTEFNVGAGLYYFDPYIFAGLAISDLLVLNGKSNSSIDVYAGNNFSFFPYRYVLKSSLLYKRYDCNNIFHINEQLFYDDKVGLGLNYTVSYTWGVSLDVKIKDNIWLFYGFENHVKTAYSGLKSHSIGLYYNPKYLRRIFKNVRRFRNLYNY